MKILNTLLPLAFAILTVTGCAEKAEESATEAELRSFHQWMAIHHPGLEAEESGIYLEWLRRSPEGTRIPETGDWLLLNWRGTDVNGRIYSTRYEEEAVRLGTFSYYTHYVPYYTNYNAYISVNPGELIGISRMREGDSLRVYMPSTMAYRDLSPSIEAGFEGEVNFPRTKPVIVDIVLEKIVHDEKAYEMEAVREVAAEWGLAELDTLRRGLYLKVIEEDPSAEYILKDSTVYIDYTGRFLDGFLLESTLNEIVETERNVSTEHMNLVPTAYIVGMMSYIDAFISFFGTEKVKYNSKYQIVFTSDWGYGDEGQAGDEGSPAIYPYTPMTFEITTKAKNYNK